MAHSFFRNPQFKSDVFLLCSTVFSNHFFNAFLMRPGCCSHWSSQFCFVPQTCCPPLLAQTAVPKICAYINTFISTYCLHAADKINRRNFFCSHVLNKGTLLENCTASQPSLWLAGNQISGQLGFQGCIRWTGDMWLCNWFYAVFVTLMKNMRGGKTFHPALTQNVQNFSASDGLPHIQMSS